MCLRSGCNEFVKEGGTTVWPIRKAIDLNGK
jgi:hypothetical protein